MSIFSLLPNLTQKTIDEYAGPCPFCGGHDRFVLKPGANFWLCRQCTPRGDDLTSLVMRLKGCNYPAACQYLGKPQKRASSHSGASGGHASKGNAPAFPLVREEKKLWTPAGQAVAAKLLDDCQQNLLPSFMRACDVVTFLQCGLGWNWQDQWFEPRQFGLTEGKKLCLARGLVIAVRRSGCVVGLCVRTPDDDRPEWQGKLHYVRGSHDLAFIAGPEDARNRPVMIVESAICAASCWQESQERIIGVGTMGKTKTRLDPVAQALVENARPLLLCPDMDEGPARQQTISAWRKAWPHGRIVALPEQYKDPNALLLAEQCGDPPFSLADWLEACLVRYSRKRAA